MGRRKKERVVAESREVCDTWVFGCAHSPIWGSSSNGGFSKDHWQSSCHKFQGRQQETHSFSSVFFPSPPTPVTIISSQSNKFHQLKHVWPGRPPLTTVTFHIHGQKDRAGLLPAQHSPGPWASAEVWSKVHRWMNLLGVPFLCAEPLPSPPPFFLVMDVCD